MKASNFVGVCIDIPNLASIILQTAEIDRACNFFSNRLFTFIHCLKLCITFRVSYSFHTNSFFICPIKHIIMNDIQCVEQTIFHFIYIGLR